MQRQRQRLAVVAVMHDYVTAPTVQNVQVLAAMRPPLRDWDCIGMMIRFFCLTARDYRYVRFSESS